MSVTNPAATDGAARPQTPRKRNEIPFPERATCTINQACAGTGIGRTLLYELMGEKLVLSKMVKGRRLVNVPSLLKAVGYKQDGDPGERH